MRVSHLISMHKVAYLRFLSKRLFLPSYTPTLHTSQEEITLHLFLSFSLYKHTYCPAIFPTRMYRVQQYPSYQPSQHLAGTDKTFTSTPHRHSDEPSREKSHRTSPPPSKEKIFPKIPPAMTQDPKKSHTQPLILRFTRKTDTNPETAAAAPGSSTGDRILPR